VRTRLFCKVRRTDWRALLAAERVLAIGWEKGQENSRPPPHVNAQAPAAPAVRFSFLSGGMPFTYVPRR
jgi:hypothetical protein